MTLALVLLACRGAAEPEAHVEPEVTQPPGTYTPGEVPDMDDLVVAFQVAEKVTDNLPEFTGAGAICDDPTAVLLIAEVLNGADRIWVDAYLDASVVATYELVLDDTELTTFQEGRLTLADADCAVDAWVWHAQRGTESLCMVTGDRALAVAPVVGCPAL